MTKWLNTRNLLIAYHYFKIDFLSLRFLRELNMYKIYVFMIINSKIRYKNIEFCDFDAIKCVRAGIFEDKELSMVDCVI